MNYVNVGDLVPKLANKSIRVPRNLLTGNWDFTVHYFGEGTTNPNRHGWEANYKSLYALPKTGANMTRITPLKPAAILTLIAMLLTACGGHNRNVVLTGDIRGLTSYVVGREYTTKVDLIASPTYAYPDAYFLTADDWEQRAAPPAPIRELRADPKRFAKEDIHLIPAGTVLRFVHLQRHENVVAGTWIEPVFMLCGRSLPKGKLVSARFISKGDKKLEIDNRYLVESR